MQAPSILSMARSKARAGVNSAMAGVCGKVGHGIVGEWGGEERARYGDSVIGELAANPIRDAPRTELSRVRCRRLILVPDAGARVCPRSAIRTFFSALDPRDGPHDPPNLCCSVARRLSPWAAPHLRALCCFREETPAFLWGYDETRRARGPLSAELASHTS